MGNYMIVICTAAACAAIGLISSVLCFLIGFRKGTETFQRMWGYYKDENNIKTKYNVVYQTDDKKISALKENERKGKMDKIMKGVDIERIRRDHI